MKKTLLITAASMFALGFCVNSYAISNPISKIAVVDVPAVVSKSAQIKALQKEQAQKIEDLQKWLKVATADVDKQQTKEGKQKLLKKYNEEYARKQETISKNYEQKLVAIDKSISSTIAQQAKTNGYDVVLAKGVVLYGGYDITESVAKAVK